jgi:hypothetical protein
MDDGAVMDDRKLTAAKLWLVSPPPDGSGRRSAERPRDLPYLSHALYALVTVPAPEVPTMTCDEWWRVYVNEDWLAAASVPDVARELAHVVWHLLSDHTGRGAQHGRRLLHRPGVDHRHRRHRRRDARPGRAAP